MNLLELRDLCSAVHPEGSEEGIAILKGVDLEVNLGEIHVLMGANGSGKSSLAHLLMGHPNHRITGGEMLLDGQDLSEMEPDERARAGLFLAFQYPHAIQGLPVGTFLKAAAEARRGEELSFRVFKRELDDVMGRLGISKEFLGRSLNDGFSGGEKKRNEILQMHLLQPRLAMLDETDSGLDVDALRLVFKDIREIASPENAFLVITHYDRVLDYINPTHVHIMRDGRIVKSGGADLSKRIDEYGFESVLAEEGVHE